MAHKIADRIKEIASSAGLLDFTLAGAAAGYEAFSSFLVDGDTTWYCAVNGAEWEIGIGTRTGATSLARTTIKQSSAADAKVNFGAPPTVFCTVPAEALATVVPAPMFSAKVTAQQGFAANNWSKINFPIEEADPDNIYDAANSRFQPTRAGWYWIEANVLLSVATGYCEGALYKNGAAIKTGTAGNSSQAAQIAGAVYLNGSTDYLEVYVYSTVAATTHGSDFTGTHFAGFLVRAA